MAVAPNPDAAPRRARRPPSARRLLWLSRWQRGVGGAHRALALSLAALLVVLGNLLVARLNLAWRLPGATPPLEARSLAVLATTRGTIRCTALLPRTHPAFEPLRELLYELRDAARDANGADMTLAFVDPYRDLEQAALLARRVGLSGHAVIVDSGDRHEVVPLAEILPAAPEPDAPGNAGTPSFQGETACVAALARLNRVGTPVIYALGGHGERDIEDDDPQNGYTSLAREVRREGFEIRPLRLPPTGSLPADGALLLIAGPRRAFADEELAQLQAYLDQGGRLLLLADRGPRTGLERVVETLGLRFTGLAAVGSQTTDGHTLRVDRFADHPVARDLRNTGVLFVAPQALDLLAPAGTAARNRATVVAAAPDGAWGEASPEIVPRHFDPGVDRQGLLPLVVAIERGVGSRSDIGLRSLRAVVIGDSLFAANALLAGGRTGNRDLLLNAMGWLAGDPPTPPSPGTAGGALHVDLTRRQRLRLLLKSALYWPLAIGLWGAACVAFRRRRIG